MEPILNLTSTLHLGLVDADSFDAFEQQRDDYFKKYHHRFWDTFNKSADLRAKRRQFRGEGLDEWVEPRKIAGDNIKRLQTFLQIHGFMPGARIDGVFGYWTLASVRLFQEYIRTVESIKEIGIPDGRVGNGTHEHMMRWAENDLYSEWGPNQVNDSDYAWTRSTPEYDHWINLLNKGKNAYLQELAQAADPSDNLELFQLQEVNKFDKASDSRKIADWTFDRKDIHLLGLRCNHEIGASNRGNDDLFILLMNGLVFKFWGSTDPNPSPSLSKKNEPYLVEGQHRYRLSWHRRDASNKVYKSLVPHSSGVLVFRDWSENDALSESDIRKGLQFNSNPADPELNNPNGTINIHWTADGRSNWSAGCQVISGRSYLNHQGKLIDCSGFSAGAYEEVSPVSRPGVRRNRGAYTFLSDFVFVYTPPGIDYVLYTLGRDGSLAKFADEQLLDTLADQKVLEHIRRDNHGSEALIQGLVDLMKKPTAGDLA